MNMKRAIKKLQNLLGRNDVNFENISLSDGFVSKVDDKGDEIEKIYESDKNDFKLFTITALVVRVWRAMLLDKEKEPEWEDE